MDTKTPPIFDLFEQYATCQSIAHASHDLFDRIDKALPKCVPYAAELADQVYECLDSAQSDILGWFAQNPVPASFVFHVSDGASIEMNIHRADLSPDFVAEIIGRDVEGWKQAYRVRRGMDNIIQDLLFIHHRTQTGVAGLPDIFNSLKE